jgi:hypothetical protein
LAAGSRCTSRAGGPSSHTCCNCIAHAPALHTLAMRSGLTECRLRACRRRQEQAGGGRSRQTKVAPLAPHAAQLEALPYATQHARQAWRQRQGENAAAICWKGQAQVQAQAQWRRRTPDVAGRHRGATHAAHCLHSRGSAAELSMSAQASQPLSKQGVLLVQAALCSPEAFLAAPARGSQRRLQHSPAGRQQRPPQPGCLRHQRQRPPCQRRWQTLHCLHHTKPDHRVWGRRVLLR